MSYKLIHSLHKDTLLNINGSSVKLETIQIGDLVQGRDLTNGVDRENQVVAISTGTIEEYLKIGLSDGSILKTSIDIDLLSKNGEWVSPIGKVKHNTKKESCSCNECGCDEFLWYGGQVVTSLELVKEELDVVSITVEPDHNYYVGSILIHNSGPQGAQGQKGQKGATGLQGNTGNPGLLAESNLQNR